MSTFFEDKPDQKLPLFQNLPICIQSNSSPLLIWTSPWLDWKTLFVKLHTDTFLSAKCHNDISTFFLDNPDQKFCLFQNLLRCMHSHSSPHFIWTRIWLDWKTLFVKLHIETFIGAKFDNDLTAFFVDNPDKKLLLFKNLLNTSTLTLNFLLYAYTSTLTLIPFGEVLD